MVTQTLMNLFTSLVGDVPPEFEGLIYVFGIFVVLYCIDQFFVLLSTIFGVTKWT